MFGTTTGLVSPERPDGPLSDNSSDTARCACGDPLDGFDARRDEATCEACARLRADGGEDEHLPQHAPAESWLVQAAAAEKVRAVRDGTVYHVTVEEVESE